MMVRMLPESVIATIAKAVELHALSQTLDRSLLARLPRADGQFSVSEYCRAYRRMGKRPERERQIRLIGEIGMRARRVRAKAVDPGGARPHAPAGAPGRVRRAARFPRARLRRLRAGWATRSEFLATIDARERALMEALLAGETAPFPDPLLPRASAPPRRGDGRLGA